MDSNKESAVDNSVPQTRNSLNGQSVPKKLTNLLMVNIAVLSIVGVLSVILLMFGDFEGKTSRVLSTLLVFAAFTVYTSFATQITNSPRSVQIAQSANIYMLVLSLVLIWATLGTKVYSGYVDYGKIMWGTIGLIVITGLGSYLMQALSKSIDSDYLQVKNSALLGTWTFGLSVVLLTLPIGLSDLFEFTSFYWKVAVSVLLITGVAMSIQALVTRFFTDKPSNAGVVNRVKSRQQDAQKANVVETAPVFAQEAATAQDKPVAHNPLQGSPAEYAKPQATSVGAWPLYPNGLPLPALPSGRPDYASLQYIAAIFVESEKQWTKN